MTTGAPHLQPLGSSRFFIGGVMELLVGGHHLLQMFLLTAAELLIFLSLKVLCAVRPTIGLLETDGQTNRFQTVERLTGQDVDLLPGGEQVRTKPWLCCRAPRFHRRRLRAASGQQTLRPAAAADAADALPSSPSCKHTPVCDVGSPFLTNTKNIFIGINFIY